VIPEAFAPAQRELLRLVLNRLVPAGGDFPAAGDLGVGAYLEQVAGASAATRRLFLDGLQQISVASGRQHPDGFAALSGDQQDAVLRLLEREHGEFFEILVRQTYSGYYSHAVVLPLLGVDAPPQPRGHVVGPVESGLVAKVRRSGFTYRQV
jgi:hypothetical protein